jgi:hypothetical protein
MRSWLDARKALVVSHNYGRGIANRGACRLIVKFASRKWIVAYAFKIGAFMFA